MSTLVTGATGFVGSVLLPKLKDVVVCSRHPDRAKKDLGNSVVDIIQFDAIGRPLDLSQQPRFETVINLMGEPIAAGRWTVKKKRRIYNSRVIGTRHLIDGIVNSNRLPAVFISASAVGIYGDAQEDVITENHLPGDESTQPTAFLIDLCKQWEQETDRLREHGVRVVNLRVGIVLGSGGGALSELIPVFRWGVGGRLGSGRQWMPWIHIDDLAKLILCIIQTDSISGPVNATAPNPVRNMEFTKKLASQLHRPAFLPIPEIALRMVLGEFAFSLLASQRVVPELALSNGFEFQYSHLGPALEDLIQ